MTLSATRRALLASMLSLGLAACGGGKSDSSSTTTTPTPTTPTVTLSSIAVSPATVTLVPGPPDVYGWGGNLGVQQVSVGDKITVVAPGGGHQLRRLQLQSLSRVHRRL